MAVGGDDDTLASSLPTLDGSSAVATAGELVGGRYRIVRWLGGGGMGRVYEALDTELEERIALKVLKSGMTVEALERFRREVKLTRRIQHRNVCRMFDIGEHKSEKFLTMELVDGEPLTRLMTDKPMPWPQVKAIAVQICAGLVAAHATGVVHRDLKPDNVLIESNTERAVLTDFGIARSGDDPGVTQIGTIVGTPRYMAPEQLAGQEVDARADLFSLGVMLFELATATRPWPGDSPISIAVAQATTAPRTVETDSSSIPAFFAALVASCLQIDPRDRPESAAEIIDALAEGRPPRIGRNSDPALSKQPMVVRPKPPTTAPRLPATPTIAEAATLTLLPIGCAPADEYLADGLLEDLTDTLSTTPGLRVRPAGVLRQATVDARDVGQRLGVDHVVTGSLRRTPKGLRIATRLISVNDGFQVWASKTDSADADVLSIADEIAKGIAEALSTHASVDSKPTDPRAVDLYLRARAELRRFWGSHVQAAATLIDQALEYAPTSAPLLAAAAYANVYAWVMSGNGQNLPRAQEALERGMATGHGEAFLASAQYHWNRGDTVRGASDLGRALIRAPMSGPVHETAGRLLSEVSGTKEARQHYETSRGLDPGRAQIIESELARLDGLDGNWAEGEARYKRLLADEDIAIRQLAIVGSARFETWREDRARILETAKTFVAQTNLSVGGLFHFINRIGETGRIDDEAWAGLMAITPAADAPKRQYLVRLQVGAEVAIAFGDIEKGIEGVARAIELGLMDITWLTLCPPIRKLVGHPRYAELHREVSDRASRTLTAFRAARTT